MSVCWFPGFTRFSSQSEATLVKLSKQNEQTKNTKYCYSLVNLKLLGIIQIDIQNIDVQSFEEAELADSELDKQLCWKHLETGQYQEKRNQLPSFFWGSIFGCAAYFGC